MNIAQNIIEAHKLKFGSLPPLQQCSVSGSALFNADCMDILPLIPDKSVQLIFADPPYYRVKGDFDFVWKNFDDYLQDVERWAIECKRVLADNGTILWYGHSKNIAYSQIILDKYFTLESNIAIELTAGHIRRSNKESFRRFAPCSERILMYSTGKNNKELCGDLISKINETATANKFIDCFIKLGICKNEASAKVLATYKIGKHKTRFDLMSKRMYDFIGGWNYSYEYFTELFNKSIRTFNSKGITDVFRYKENTKDMSSTNHPTQKPMELTKMFIEMTTNQKDNVLIPFVGSGTECKSAKELNRSFIGIEKEVKYYNLAVERVFPITQSIYKNIQTKENYDKLLSSGMFWEFHPELSGNWDIDRCVVQHCH